MNRHANMGSFLLLSLLASITFACASHIDLKAGMLFLDARSALQRENWKPVDVHTKDGYEFIGVEKKLKDQHIDEVESCAIDFALCIFNYRKNEKCLRLITHGEEVNDMRVRSWSYTCP